MRVRRLPAESGTCGADLCTEIVHAARTPNAEGEITVRQFCFTHAAERDAELAERNARGETSEVIQLSDYERDEKTGRARLKVAF